MIFKTYFLVASCLLLANSVASNSPLGRILGMLMGSQPQPQPQPQPQAQLAALPNPNATAALPRSDGLSGLLALLRGKRGTSEIETGRNSGASALFNETRDDRREEDRWGINRSINPPEIQRLVDRVRGMVKRLRSTVDGFVNPEYETDG